MITKNKNNKSSRDDDGDKGSDCMKPRTEKKGPKPLKADKCIALKSIRDSLWETRAQCKECKRYSSKKY
jgi:hypothetical protein